MTLELFFSALPIKHLKKIIIAFSISLIFFFETRGVRSDIKQFPRELCCVLKKGL